MAKNTAPVLSHRQATAAVDEWNAAHPVGTPIAVTQDDGSVVETTTRSEAWCLGHGEPVVKYAGRAGCYLLSRVRAL